jgi:hypothetical protein
MHWGSVTRDVCVCVVYWAEREQERCRRKLIRGNLEVSLRCLTRWIFPSFFTFLFPRQTASLPPLPPPALSLSSSSSRLTHTSPVHATLFCFPFLPPSRLSSLPIVLCAFDSDSFRFPDCSRHRPGDRKVLLSVGKRLRSLSRLLLFSSVDGEVRA